MALPRSEYVRLTTFRRSGEPVATPVWAGPDGDTLVVWTNAGSGKAKRLRHTSRVTVAPCDVRGNVKGPAVEGVAEFVDPRDWPAAVAALTRRYGWRFRLWYSGAQLWRGLRRSPEQRTFLRIHEVRPGRS